MKKLIYTAIIALLLIVNSVFAANPGKEINNKCRSNLKKLNSATDELLKTRSDIILPRWITYKQATETFLDVDKFLDGKEIKGPTMDCRYFLISKSNKDYQWLCDIHGLLDGDKTISFRYREYQLQGKTSERYMDNNNYKQHVQNLLRWTEYSPTPLELYKYHYNMNPITTTILTIVILVASFFTLKTFFKF